MGRDDQIEAIVEIGRRTRRSAPRWMWIAAMLVGVICTTGFAVAMLGDRAPRDHRSSHPPPADAIDGRPATGPGLGIGLVIGACGGLVIGVAIARQCRSHSSRNRP